ncbi:MAG: PTS sugar transporter subunit IIC [Enterococcus raffinosus]
MSLTMAIVAGLWYWIGPARPGYTFQQFFCQPLVMALIFGIIHGDVAQAMIIGAGIEPYRWFMSVWFILAEIFL